MHLLRVLQSTCHRRLVVLTAREIDLFTCSREPRAAPYGGYWWQQNFDQIGYTRNLVTNVQNPVIGGAMANTFLLADGLGIGTSLCEPDMVGTVKRIKVKEEQGCELILPSDAVTAPALEAGIDTGLWASTRCLLIR